MSKNDLESSRASRLTPYSLNQQDRDLLKKAGSKVSTHAGIASLAGLGLGVYCGEGMGATRVFEFDEGGYGFPGW